MKTRESPTTSARPRPAAVAVVAGLLVAALYGFLTDPRPPADVALDPIAAPAAGSQPTPIQEALSPASRDSDRSAGPQAPTRTAQPNGTVVTGRVLDAEGEPLEDAEVTLHLGYWDVDLGPEPEGPHARTDRAGRFSVSCATLQWISDHVVSAKGHAAYSDFGPWGEEPPYPSQIDVGDIQLVRESTIGGIVQSEDGRSVLCAHVEVTADGVDHEAPVHPDGSFHVGQLGADVSAAIRVVCDAGCHANVSVYLALGDGESITGLVYPLLRNRIVQGAVTTVDDRPIEGAQIRVEFENDKQIAGSLYPVSAGTGRATTDAAGTFRTSNPRPFRRVIVHMSATGYADQSVELLRDGTSADSIMEVRLIAHPAPMLIVVLTDAVTGAAVVDARVHISPVDARSRDMSPPLSAGFLGDERAAGEYAFTCGEGLWTAKVESKAYGEKITEPFAAGAAALTRVDVALDPPFVTRIQVVAADTSAPLKDARVWVSGDVHRDQRNANMWEGVPTSYHGRETTNLFGCRLKRSVDWNLYVLTDRLGRATIPCRTESPLHIRVEAVGYGAILDDHLVARRDGEELIVKVPRAGSIDGLVIGYDGRPLAGRNILIHREDGVLSTVRSGDGGRFECGPLACSEYLLFVGTNTETFPGNENWSRTSELDAPGFAEPDARVRVLSGVTHVTVDQRGLRTGAVAGTATVRSFDGPAHVGLLAAGNPGRADYRVGYLGQTQADDDGTFILERVPPGRYQVTLSTDRLGPVLLERTVEVFAGSLTRVGLDTQAALLTVFTSSSADGSTVSNAVVAAIRDDGRRFRSEKSEINEGVHTFAPLPPGTYVLESHAPGFSHGFTTVSLQPGANARTVSLPVQADLIVTIASGHSLEFSPGEVTITLHAGSVLVDLPRTVGDDGHTFRFDAVPAGTLQVDVAVETLTGTYRGEAPVEVTPGTTSTVTVWVSDADGTGTEERTDSGG